METKSMSDGWWFNVCLIPVNLAVVWYLGVKTTWTPENGFICLMQAAALASTLVHLSNYLGM